MCVCVCVCVCVCRLLFFVGEGRRRSFGGASSFSSVCVLFFFNVVFFFSFFFVWGGVFFGCLFVFWGCVGASSETRRLFFNIICLVCWCWLFLNWFGVLLLPVCCFVEASELHRSVVAGVFCSLLVVICIAVGCFFCWFGVCLFVVSW